MALPVAIAGAAAALALATPAPAAGPAGPAGGAGPGGPGDLGEQLYLTQCASCHAVDGRGIEGRGPDLTREGRASVDFAVRTGRMPLADPEMQARRQRVRFSEEQIRALVDYAGAFGSGPDIPAVDPANGDLAAGGVLYRLNCAACHVASGAGAAIGGSREAPDLMSSTPVEIGEAILIGPGAMPSFGSFSPQDIDSVARYVLDLQERETTAASEFGGAGPVAEGLAAWLLGLVPLIAFTRWIGTPHEGRDTAAVAPAATEELER
jgi:ubiquinol-cytochrome c reductase cytochrome c subunit